MRTGTIAFHVTAIELWRIRTSICGLASSCRRLLIQEVTSAVAEKMRIGRAAEAVGLLRWNKEPEPRWMPVGGRASRGCGPRGARGGRGR